jgi:predicted RNA binding protein YcfA (HicA-like mRNA interferase family)
VFGAYFFVHRYFILFHTNIEILLDNTIYMLYDYVMTAREVANKLEAHGWVLDRINGSHHIYIKEGRRSIPVPFHGNKDLGPLGKRILKEAGIDDWEVL